MDINQRTYDLWLLLNRLKSTKFLARFSPLVQNWLIVPRETQ